ncbi:hypothetical protein GQ53DRAFT_772533 [Thozetella sp. PMI_491]|nr:hypothetical protein GQ53DRAFT_772533 [Thozetella sp. PMI_491]
MAVLVAWGTLLDSDQSPHAILNALRSLLELEQIFLMEEDSLPKFLVMVAYLAHKLSLSTLPRVLGSAISMIQSLKIQSEAVLRNTCSTDQDLRRAKCACWIVYCVDKLYALRWQTFPVQPALINTPHAQTKLTLSI